MPSLTSRLFTKGWEVGAVLDAVGRVEVDHLHLAGHALFFEERVHHQERIAGDQAVRPAVLVLVELDGLAQRFLALLFEEGQLYALTRPSATLSRRERVFVAPPPSGRGLG
ncbi:MAG: hypothetical protein ACP5M0_11880 [Desulfomonilaceae bacterium]